MDKGSVLLLVFTAFLLSGCQQPTSLQSSSAQHLPPPHPPQPNHYQNQLLAIRRNGLQLKKLLNASEKDIFWDLVKWASQNGYRVFPQASLGEVFRSDEGDANTNAYAAIMCKRSDFLVTGKDFTPIALIEYFGSGHHGPTSGDRDGIKLAAAETAGILFIVIEEKEKKQAVAIVDTAIKQGVSRHSLISPSMDG